MQYGLRTAIAASLGLMAACPTFVEAGAVEMTSYRVAQLGSNVTPLPETPGKGVVLPNQSGAPAPAATLQGLEPGSKATSGSNAVPVPMRSATEAPKAQPLVGSGAPNAH